MSDAEYWIATTGRTSDRVVHINKGCALKCGAFDVRLARDDEVERFRDCQKCQRDVQHSADNGRASGCPLCDDFDGGRLALHIQREHGAGGDYNE